MKLDKDGIPRMPGEWMFSVVPWFIGIVFVLVFGYFITVGILATKILKSDCIPALVSTSKDGTTQYTVGCKQ